MTSPPNKFGPLLRAAREARGLSLRDLAGKVPISLAYLHRCETGADVPSDVRIGQLAKALQVPVGPLQRAAAGARLWSAAMREEPGHTAPQAQQLATCV